MRIGAKVEIITKDVYPLAGCYKKGDNATYLGKGRWKMYDGIIQHCSVPARYKKLFKVIK